MALKIHPYDAARYLDTEEAVEEYLTAACEGGNVAEIAHALGVVVPRSVSPNDSPRPPHHHIDSSAASVPHMGRAHAVDPGAVLRPVEPVWKLGTDAAFGHPAVLLAQALAGDHQHDLAARCLGALEE